MSEVQETGTRRKLKPNRFRITSIIIAIAAICFIGSFLPFFNLTNSQSLIQPNTAHILDIPESGDDVIYSTDFVSVSGWTNVGGTWSGESGVYSCDTNGTSVRPNVTDAAQIEFNFKIVTGRFAGAVIRYVNDDYYYAVYLDIELDRVKIERVFNRVATQIGATANYALPMSAAVDYKLRVTVSAADFTAIAVYLNDSYVYGCYDSNPSYQIYTGKSGMISGYSQGGFNTHAHFDNFTLYSLPRIHYAPGIGETLYINAENGTGSHNATKTAHITVANDEMEIMNAIQQKLFMRSINYTLIVDEEAYYDFTIHEADMGAWTSKGKFVLKANNTIIGYRETDCDQTNSATSFNSKDEWVFYGTSRLAPGVYNLQVVSAINQTYASPEFGKIKVTRNSILSVEQPLFKFVQIADLHFDYDGHYGYPPWVGAGGSGITMFPDAVDILDQFVIQANAIHDLDFVVINGDLGGDDVADYAPLKVCLDNLTVPYYIVSGNHDASIGYRTEIKSVFSIAEWNFGGGQSNAYYYRDYLDQSRLIFMDDDEDNTYNNVSVDQLAWLNTTLAVNKTCLVFGHYPLVDLEKSSDYRLNSHEAVDGILGSSGNVAAYLSGHAHGNYVTQSNGYLNVGVSSLIEYPMQWSICDVFGTGIDISREDINDDRGDWLNRSMLNIDSYEAIGYTENITYHGRNLIDDGWYVGINRTYNPSGLVSGYDRPAWGHSFADGLNMMLTPSTGVAVAMLTQWSTSAFTWTVNATSPVTFTLSGLESGRMYRLYIDGMSSSLLTASKSGVVSFTYSGPWSEHQFEIVATSIGGSISGLVNLVFIMFTIGIVVGVVAEGTNSLRKMQMRTSQQMIKSLVNMVVYIIIGIASLGVLYSMVI